MRGRFLAFIFQLYFGLGVYTMIDAQAINELLGKCTIEANALQSLINNTKGDKKKCKQYLAHLSSIFSIIKALHQYENMEEY